MARLARAVHVTDPTTRRTVVLQPGEEPAPHLAALVTNPAAWEDGILPETGEGEREPAKATSNGDEQDPTGDDKDTPKPAAAKKTAATKAPARGRKAADQGSSGQ